eukprot:COSAG05_NODE_4688_length_1408_cov_1.627196_3_plen_189_part_00
MLGALATLLWAVPSTPEQAAAAHSGSVRVTAVAWAKLCMDAAAVLATTWFCWHEWRGTLDPAFAWAHALLSELRTLQARWRFTCILTARDSAWMVQKRKYHDMTDICLCLRGCLDTGAAVCTVPRPPTRGGAAEGPTRRPRRLPAGVAYDRSGPVCGEAAHTWETPDRALWRQRQVRPPPLLFGSGCP